MGQGSGHGPAGTDQERDKEQPDDQDGQYGHDGQDGQAKQETQEEEDPALIVPIDPILLNVCKPVLPVKAGRSTRERVRPRRYR